MDEDSNCGKQQQKLSKYGVTTPKRKSEETESSGKGSCKFFKARKPDQLTHFYENMISALVLHLFNLTKFKQFARVLLLKYHMI